MGSLRTWISRLPRGTQARASHIRPSSWRRCEGPGRRPREAIHVGDQYETDVKGALGVGIRPVFLDRDKLSKAPGDCPRIEGLAELVGLVRGLDTGDLEG